jgi:hypothetical protein
MSIGQISLQDCSNAAPWTTCGPRPPDSGFGTTIALSSLVTGALDIG